MNRRSFLMTTAAAAATFVPSVARGHEGHMHHVLGTVEKVALPHVDVKTADGNTVTVMLDKDTTVTRGKDKLDASAIAVGERVSIDYMEENKMLMAHAVKLGAAAKK
jgi:hypothetical protein